MTSVVASTAGPGTSGVPVRDLDTTARERLADAFRIEERASLRLLMYVRLAVSAAIIVFLMSNFFNTGGLYWSGLTVVFALLGIVQYRIAVSPLHARWHKYVWIFLDIAHLFVQKRGNVGSTVATRGPHALAAAGLGGETTTLTRSARIRRARRVADAPEPSGHAVRPPTASRAA